MIRGLIEEIDDKKNMVQKYQITFDFLKHLGLSEPAQLPDYDKLNSNESLEKLLNQPKTNEGDMIWKINILHNAFKFFNEFNCLTFFKSKFK